jgi:aerobic-type carbon monoxide dehydrogenase small subunit (CoxS/CutS family)
MHKINLTINNKNVTLNLSGHETLMEVLRNQLGLTGTKTACEESECGTCTVQINGKAVLSCITLACDVEGDNILTIEGVANGEQLHPVQQAYLDYICRCAGYPKIFDAVKKAGEVMLKGSQDINASEKVSREKLANIDQGLTYEEYVRISVGVKAEDQK